MGVARKHAPELAFDTNGYAIQPAHAPELSVLKQLVDMQCKTDEERRQLQQETISLRKERHLLREEVRKLESANKELRRKVPGWD